MVSSKSGQGNGRFQPVMLASSQRGRPLIIICVLPQSVVARLGPVSIAMAGMSIRGYHFVTAVAGETGPPGSSAKQMHVVLFSFM